MIFEILCVWLVITILIMFVTFGIGWITKPFDIGNDDYILTAAWTVSSIGFGVCLTILLYQNGIL